MNRIERRQLERAEAKKKKTYNLTQEQIDIMINQAVKQEVQKIKQDVTDEVTNQAMILLLTLPLEVLKTHYWPKTAKQKLPEFTECVLALYSAWQNDELDMDELIQDLWEYGGIRLEMEK